MAVADRSLVRKYGTLFSGSLKQQIYSELTKTSTALARLAVLSVLSSARRLVLIFVNPL